ncbi:hypothetical protein V1281_004435 [Nitrobacteraceae bacterium AZCC 2161]
MIRAILLASATVTSMRGLHNMAPIAFLGACFWVDEQEQS